MKPLRTELKQRMEAKTKPPEVKREPYTGKGTRARLNTAAEKMMFKTQHS